MAHDQHSSEQSEHPLQSTSRHRVVALQWYGSISQEQLRDLEGSFAYLTSDGNWYVPDWLQWLHRQVTQQGDFV